MIPGSFHSRHLQFKPQQSGRGPLRGSGALWPHQLHPGVSVPSIPTAGWPLAGPYSPQPGWLLGQPLGQQQKLSASISFCEGLGAEQVGSLDWDAHSTTVKKTKSDMKSCPSCQHLGALPGGLLPSPSVIPHTWLLHVGNSRPFLSGRGELSSSLNTICNPHPRAGILNCSLFVSDKI